MTTIKEAAAKAGMSIEEYLLKINSRSAFVTKDSGARQEFDSGMHRDTQEGKPRFDLITPGNIPYEQQMLTRWAALMARGSMKYEARNWEKARGAEELDRFRASAFRHFMEWFCSADDGEDHAAAIMFNVQGAEYVDYHLLHG